MRSFRRAPRLAAPAVVKPAQPAAGVEYRDGGHGLQVFDCAPLSATMTMKGCAARWRQAREAKGAEADQYVACQSCPIGAAHAGERHVEHGVLYGGQICPRCRRGTTRMIRNRVCVSCQNRAYEVESGRNARGNVPSTLLRDKPVRRVEVTISVDGRVRRLAGAGVDSFEIMLQAARTTPGVIVFARAASRGATPQGRLF